MEQDLIQHTNWKVIKKDRDWEGYELGRIGISKDRNWEGYRLGSWDWEGYELGRMGLGKIRNKKDKDWEG